MRRRQFIAGLGCAAAWPVVARAQQPERMRRIGVLTLGDENDPVTKPRYSAFTQALAGLLLLAARQQLCLSDRGSRSAQRPVASARRPGRILPVHASQQAGALPGVTASDPQLLRTKPVLDWFEPIS